MRPLNKIQVFSTVREKDLFEKVSKFFESEDKARSWFQTKNPLLGNITPVSMIQMGRTDKLADFIDAQLEENRP